MREKSWCVRLIKFMVAATVFYFWYSAYSLVENTLNPLKFNKASIYFSAHLSGLLLLVVSFYICRYLMPSPIPIKLGKIFNKNSCLFLLSIFIISLSFHFCNLLLGTPYEEATKSQLQTPWPHIIFVIIQMLVLAPIGEEILFRGYLAGAFPLEKKWGVAISMTFTAVLFSRMHYEYQNLLTFIEIIVMGVVIFWARISSGGLGLPIFLHSLANVLAIVQYSLLT